MSTNTKSVDPVEIKERVDAACMKIFEVLTKMVSQVVQEVKDADPDLHILQTAMVQAFVNVTNTLAIQLNYPTDLYYAYLASDYAKEFTALLKKQDSFSAVMDQLAKMPMGSA